MIALWMEDLRQPYAVSVMNHVLSHFNDPSVEFGFQFQSPPQRPGTALAPKAENPLPAACQVVGRRAAHRTQSDDDYVVIHFFIVQTRSGPRGCGSMLTSS